MNDVVLVAVIGSGCTLAAAFLAQVVGVMAASKQADRAERKEALQFQRAQQERIRIEKKAALSELLKEVEAVQAAFVNYSVGSPKPPALVQPASASLRATRIATLEVPELREATTAFHKTTAMYQESLFNLGGDPANVKKAENAKTAFKAAMKELSESIATFASTVQ